MKKALKYGLLIIVIMFGWVFAKAAKLVKEDKPIKLSNLKDSENIAHADIPSWEDGGDDNGSTASDGSGGCGS